MSKHGTKKFIFRAGIIPYYKDEKTQQIVMMFMRPSDPKFGGDRLQIAKGKIDPGEATLAAALREGNEELGLREKNISHLELLGQYLGRTSVFVCKVRTTDPALFDSPMFETGETKWLTLDEFLEQGKDLHFPIVKAAIRKITKIEENING